MEDRPNREEWFTLDEQKEHVREYIARRLAESRDGEKCVVVGHSISAHRVARAPRTRTREGSRCHRIDAIFARQHEERVAKESQFRHAIITRDARVGKTVGRFTRVRADGRVFLLRNAVTKSMDTTAAEITSAWLRWQSLINMVFMGRTEFDALTVPVTECPLVADAALPPISPPSTPRRPLGSSPPARRPRVHRRRCHHDRRRRRRRQTRFRRQRRLVSRRRLLVVRPHRRPPRRLARPRLSRIDVSTHESRPLVESPAPLSSNHITT